MKESLEVSGIYKIENKLNGKVYIGSSVNIHLRWKDHVKKLNKGCHANRHLQRAWIKYGEDCFEFSVIEHVENKEDLILKEQHHLDSTKSYINENGYNIARYAGSTLGVSPSSETRKKISLAVGGKNHYMWGKSLPKETREKIGRYHRGKTYTMSEEHKNKIRKAQDGEKGNNAKLREEDVKEIKLIIEELNVRSIIIANYYNVKRTTISAIKTGRAWRNTFFDKETTIPEYFYQLDDKSERRKNLIRNCKLNETSVREIKMLLEDGELSQSQIGKMYGVSQARISKIKNGENWSHVKINMGAIQ